MSSTQASTQLTEAWLDAWVAAEGQDASHLVNRRWERATGVMTQQPGFDVRAGLGGPIEHTTWIDHREQPDTALLRMEIRLLSARRAHRKRGPRLTLC